MNDRIRKDARKETGHMEKPSDCIKLDHIYYSIATFDGYKTILNDIDLTITRGEWVAIVGRNGSGKSTLAKVLTKIVPVSAGTIHFNIEERPPVQLIPQNPETQIIGETVLEDVCFGLHNYGIGPHEAQSRAMEALEAVGLAYRVNDPPSALSGGQKQLLNIAGCLALKPPVYIFDEATSMLDPVSRENILKIAHELHQKGTTIVWITQLLDELAWADRVIALDQGEIVFNGTARQFFYRQGEQRFSFCEQLGFPPPFSVQVACSLIRQGIRLDPLPVSPEELAKVVSGLR
jgi:energy-coupling factor transport system ATP-binding protein